jgi:integrase
MAVITKRGDLQYQVKIRMAGHPAISRTFPSKKLAEDFARVTESEMIRGEFIPRRTIEPATLGKVLERYGKEVSKNKKGEKQELVRINRLRKHPIAKKLISAITPEDIEDYVSERRTDRSKRNPIKTVSEATIGLELMLLSGVFEQSKSKRWNYCRTNPVREIDASLRPGKSMERTRRFVGDEESRLMVELSKCRNKDIERVVMFAIHTAARQSEIIGKSGTTTRPASPGLTWEDVDLAHRSVTFRNTKNGRDRRVPINEAALKLLSDLPRPIAGGKVFKVSQDGLIRAFSAACDRAGIADFTFHDLRHEATTRMVEAGLSLLEVQSITGHSTGEMVKRYTHLDTLKLAKKLG